VLCALPSAWLLACALACGARSALPEGVSTDGGVPPVPCDDDADCFFGDRCQPYVCVEGLCQPGVAVTCDDGDPCTTDRCFPPTGECVFHSAVSDLDGDGFFGPRPGFAPGVPGSCGDDCDDTSPDAFPGGSERCDGVDNDCNGVVDDGARYEPSGDPVVRVSSTDHTIAGVGGLAYNQQLYGVTYHGQQEHWRPFFRGLAADGTTVVQDLPITNVGNDSYSGPLIWTGAVFATAWEDRREEDYEIYFNRLDFEGNKLGPDVRLSFAEDFSLNPQLLWTGAEFVVVWEDRRAESRQHRIYGQRLSAEGMLIGGNVELTELEWNVGAPSLAQGHNGLALVFKAGELDARRVGFRTLSPELTELGPLVTLSEIHSVAPVVVWSEDRYVVAWHKRGPNSGDPVQDAIWGAVLSDSGDILVSERRLTFGATFARAKSLLPLGDRVLLVWSDAGPDGNFELYSKMLSLELQELTPRRRITNDPAMTEAPVARFGPDGDVAVLFEDNRSLSRQVYFTRLVCVAGP
jgi:hypothetical protein